MRVGLFDVESWYLKYRNGILNYIMTFVFEYHIAEDLMQDTFVKACTKANTYNGESSVKTWLYTIARNTTMDFLGKKKTSLQLREKFMENQLLYNDLYDNRYSEDKELYTSLNKIKNSYKKAIMLRKIQGYSIKETGEILNWSESKVKTTLSRALISLQKQLYIDEYYKTLY